MMMEFTISNPTAVTVPMPMYLSRLDRTTFYTPELKVKLSE